MGARKVVLAFTAEMVTTVNPLFSPPGGLFNLAKPLRKVSRGRTCGSRALLILEGRMEDRGEGGGGNLIKRGGLLTFHL